MKHDNWHGLMRIIEIQHIRDNKIIWEAHDILNTLHFLGEEFMLKGLFTNAGDNIPDNYYLGLDNRTDILAADTMASLSEEPTSNGYLRQAVNSTSGFVVEIKNGIHRAVSQIVSFSATGVGWGPVKNIFLANTSDTSGYLIASAPLSSPITTVGGDTINMRMSLSLRNCP